MAEKNTVGKYKKPIPKRMLKEFERKRALSSGPSLKGPTGPIKPKKYMGDDLHMSREGSPAVTDTETGETTYGRPKDFNIGVMMECRGGGIAISGKKFQGVF